MDHHTQLILFHILRIPSRTAVTAVIYGQCQSSYGRHLAVINEFCRDEHTQGFCFTCWCGPNIWDGTETSVVVLAALHCRISNESHKIASLFVARLIRGGHTCDQCCTLFVWWLTLVFVIEY